METPKYIYIYKLPHPNPHTHIRWESSIKHMRKLPNTYHWIDATRKRNLRRLFTVLAKQDQADRKIQAGIDVANPSGSHPGNRGVSPACGMPSASAMATACKIYVLCLSKFTLWRSEWSATVRRGNLKHGATVEDQKSLSIWKGHSTPLVSSGSTPMLASQKGSPAWSK